MQNSMEALGIVETLDQQIPQYPLNQCTYINGTAYDCYVVTCLLDLSSASLGGHIVLFVWLDFFHAHILLHLGSVTDT